MLEFGATQNIMEATKMLGFCSTKGNLEKPIFHDNAS